MYRFFIDSSAIDMEQGKISITGTDVNHIRSALRMKSGEQILLSTGREDDPVEYLCEIEEICPEEVTARILDLQKNARELAADIYLFQAIPKGDRFETVIEKSVELGVHEIIPVMSARTIVRLDEKRGEKKTQRWNAIALSAAKQSKRSFIPAVTAPSSWKIALAKAKEMDRILVPYEAAEGMEYTRQVLAQMKGAGSIGVFIGPEGGFEEREIGELKDAGARIITLGHRILRTDTAAIASLSMLMLQLEADA